MSINYDLKLIFPKDEYCKQIYGKISCINEEEERIISISEFTSPPEPAPVDATGLSLVNVYSLPTYFNSMMLAESARCAVARYCSRLQQTFNIVQSSNDALNG